MMFFRIIIGLILLQQISCQCTFPTDLIGTWVTSNDGTWIVNSSSIQNYETKSSTTGNDIKTGVSFLDFTCVENRGDTKYVIMSETFELFNGAFVNLYTCIDIQIISTNKIIYYQVTIPDPSGLQFTLQTVYEDICNLASYDSPYLYHVGLKSGLETSALINCPSTLFGSYNYDSCTNTTSNDTSVNVCDSRQQLIYNYTLCNTPQLYSQEGVLDCVYFTANGSITYLTLYNRDTVATDDTNYFRFVCLAIEGGPSQVSLTAYPERCLDNQNANSIASPGQSANFTSYFLCPILEPEEDSFDWLPVILAIVGVLLLLIIIAIIIICCCCCKRRKKVKDEEQATDKSDSDDEQSRKNSLREEDEEERTSLDSGISEPPPSTRTDKEHIIEAEGEGDIQDDKNSRPRSGERSRMSDLPPSTVPPEDEEKSDEEGERLEDNVKPVSDQQEETDEQTVQEQNEKDNEEKEEEKPDEDQHEEQSDCEQPEEKSDNEEEEEEKSDNEQEEEKSENEQPEETSDNEHEVEKNDNEEEEKSENEQQEEKNVDEQDGVENSKRDEQEDNSDVDQQEENPIDEQQKEESEDEQQEEKSEDEQQQQEFNDEQQTEKSDDGNESQTIEEEKREEEKSENENEEVVQSNVDGQNPVDEEAQRTEGEGMDVSSDEEERRKIGMKKGKHFTPAGTLTSVLVSRDEDERKKEKLKNKTKKQKMNKLAKDRTDRDRKGGKGGRGGKVVQGTRRGRKGKGFGRNGEGSDEELNSSDDDEARFRGGRTAPFMQQYRQKKHIEQVLDDQHYWSDPEKDKDILNIYDKISNIYDSDSSGSEEEIIRPDGQIMRVKKKKRRHSGSHESDSGSEIEVIGSDGKPMRVKKKLKQDGRERRRRKSGDKDDISIADSEYLRQKIVKRTGSLDSMLSVDDKKKLNEHTMRSEDDDSAMNNGTDDGKIKNEDRKASQNDENKSKLDQDENMFKRNGKTKTILVKEKSSEPGAIVEVTRLSKGDRKRTNADDNELRDKDIDKMSDRDSGMDDDEFGDVDVILTPEQQTLVVNMLFDEDMNVRPQFYRDDNGRIVRRLDDSVIYDPYTGRFTFRKRLGLIFKVPRLKRNDKGRPTGGYIEDEYGPKTDVDKLSRKSSSARRSRSAKSGRDIRSTSAETRRSRTDARNVGFDVPDEDLETIHDDEAEFYKRGNRSQSAMQRLKRRLFRKKQRGGSSGSGILPDVRVKRAWSSDEHGSGFGGQGGGPSGGPSGGFGPGNIRYGQRSPWTQRKGGQNSSDPNQMQMYREGLESDRKFLENLQGKLNSQDLLNRPEGFVDTDNGNNPELANQHSQEHGPSHGQGYGLHAEYSFFDDDGRFVIRERGCPELKKPKVPLFTIIRRPEDMESDEKLNEQRTEQRNVKSAPLALQDYNNEQQSSDRSDNRPNYLSENSLARSDGRYSRYSYIDNNRLRRLLEELYQDKKYLDRYVESTESKSEAVIHSKGLAEHGRGYLLERADYWEKRGPLPPRPPMTAVGWKMQRQAYLAASRQTSELGFSTNTTCTPDMSARHMPGVVESPNEDIEDNNKENKDQQLFAKSESEA